MSVKEIINSNTYIYIFKASKEEGKDQESIQSSITPDLRHLMGK